MKFKGLSKTKILRTPEDVLEHCYGGRKVEKADAPLLPSPLPPPPEGPSVDEPVEEEEMELTEEEYAAQLEEDNNKDVLIAMAEERGLSTEGYKRDLAARIAAYEYDE